MILPDGDVVTKNTPIYSGSNFTWGEVTKDCTRQLQTLIIDGKIIATADDIQDKIINAAKELDQYRELLGGRPLWVNSWYRPREVNKRVGGSKWSRHQYGDAIDIRSDYRSSQDIYRYLDKLHMSGGLGRYFSFVHVDFRGYVARWHS